MIAALAAFLIAAPTAAAPYRAEHPFAVAFELGYNGLAGLGLNAVYHPIPAVAVDAGFGYGGGGYKTGLRARWLMLDSAWSPFAGAGASLDLGKGDERIENTQDANHVSYRLRPTLYLQGVGGVQYAEDGFLFVLAGGWAHRNHENIVALEGVPNNVQKQGLDLAYQGGLVLSLALGYVF